MESPDFDRWGNEFDGAPAPSIRRVHSLAGLSLVRVAAFALVLAAVVALIVHFAGGGRTATQATRPLTHSAVAGRRQRQARRPQRLPRRLECRRHRRPGPGQRIRAVPRLERRPRRVANPELSITGLRIRHGPTVRVALLDRRLRTRIGAGPSDARLAADAHFDSVRRQRPRGADLPRPRPRDHRWRGRPGHAAPVPAVGRPQRAWDAQGSRASMTWSVNGLNFPVFVDLYVATLGHDELSLFALSSEQPYSIATEDRLRRAARAPRAARSALTAIRAPAQARRPRRRETRHRRRTRSAARSRAPPAGPVKATGRRRRATARSRIRTGVSGSRTSGWWAWTPSRVGGALGRGSRGTVSSSCGPVWAKADAAGGAGVAPTAGPTTANPPK